MTAYNIKDLRKNCKNQYSQTEFGAMLDISMRTIQNWENGVSVCNIYVYKLIKYYLRSEKLLDDNFKDCFD